MNWNNWLYADRLGEEKQTPKPQTNADRIRAMSDEELAWELMTWRIETEAKHHGVESNYPNTKSAILEWLKQPAEEGLTMNEDRCICCGAVIPESRQVCPNCLLTIKEGKTT